MHSLDPFAASHLPSIETTMQDALARARLPATEELYSMMAYHMGWLGEGAGPQAQGKRVRPLLVLLSFGAVHQAEPDWAAALPAAAAVELLHNFSLIHDDIQDNSPLRRGRPTLWQKWGIAQAINAGDAMFTLAFNVLLDLSTTRSPEIGIDAQQILQTTCMALTQGQYLDISFESRTTVTMEQYWAMIGGKTAALLAACTELGALIGGAAPTRRAAFKEFGRSLGLAFQVQDDILGIWGNEEQTGKSAASDLAAGKKSLPVIFGLSKGGAFAERWAKGSVSLSDAPVLAQQLEAEEGRAFAEEQAGLLTAKALQSLEDADPRGQAGSLLTALANTLLKRQT